MRAFIALDLPESLLRPLTRLQAGLTVGRLVEEENLHLTLAFLGDIDPGQAHDIAARMADLPDAPIALTLTNIDVMGGRKPNLVLMDARPTPELLTLHDRVTRLAREAGVTMERRRFRPHVTLARFGKQMSEKEHRGLGDFLKLNAPYALPTELADSVSLNRSHLRDDGPVYEPLAEFLLTG
ncbi:RNA 2',3'-cyclic phosphodiesterase [Maritimibacter sp. UBA3975]|uniref:RNA 2',3'-cyclic phosphodiesterase n=1 Tax=Maritimibacter sp. UBA3975 TaxID=1946833 RepID=UPI000C0955F2|nr:RNA 2',3'-cyclic phosphodiesterase [Maritimibacter sp. UBA3975]MAM60984.1 RNA 2',3'-cyclic phosphodiesterase [Maritimibacter sp.]|tara:strand:+ start:34611 stop:35156 length:546 start_codon:yes stop_codon:yes gene_type:complete